MPVLAHYRLRGDPDALLDAFEAHRVVWSDRTPKLAVADLADALSATAIGTVPR